MSLDLTQFHVTFFEESFEALDGMEFALLRLSAGEPDAELIHTIFRAAHCIKGGAAIFGFAEIASFTHTLETYLDALRGGYLIVNQLGIDLLLKSVDLLRSTLTSVRQGNTVDQHPVAALQSDLERLSQVVDPPDSGVGEPVHYGAGAVVARPGGDVARHAKLLPGGWHIDFKPHRTLLQQGNEPLCMFGELQRLGALQPRVDIGNLPLLNLMNPELCYLAWDLRVHGEVVRADVEEIFEWVADDCEVLIRALTSAAELPLPNQPVPALCPERAIDLTAPQQTNITQIWYGESGSIRVSIEKIDELINRVGELVITQSMLHELGGSGTPEVSRLQIGLERLERNTRELQESVMRMRMLPVNTVFSRLPRVVRDLGRKMDKQVELTLSGGQTELDKNVLEKIGDPLVHLLRNAIDHGIEKPSMRRQLGKLETGHLRLAAAYKGGRINIRLSDDGAGLDREKILARARSDGLVQNEEISDAAIYDLIFHPGLSTAEQTTELSGRGVGMDVVRKNIRALGGSVEVSSERGRGTTFSIVLPLTLAIMDGQSVVLGDENYIIPLVSIVESLQPRAGLVGHGSNCGELLLFRDEYVPILRLDELFGTRIQSRSPSDGLIVIVESDERRIGIVVDDLLGQQQIVLKSLEENYRKVKGISGATILGGGSVALILDVPELMRIAQERGAA